jgi:hypothetical protein
MLFSSSSRFSVRTHEKKNYFSHSSGEEIESWMRMRVGYFSFGVKVRNDENDEH